MAGSAAIDFHKDGFGLLRGMSVFSHLPDDAVKSFFDAASWAALTPGEKAPAQSAEEERYWFVANGQIAVTLDRRPKDPAASRWFKNRTDSAVDHLTYLAVNDFYSDAALPGEADANGLRVECVSLIAATLAGIPRSVLAPAMRAHPDWAMEMNTRNAALRAHYRSHKTPDLHVAQEFFLRHGYSFATTLKVIDLDRCIACNACEDSCTARHGTARLERIGPVLGRLAFPISCRTCVDHRCVSACGFDAMTFNAEAHEARVDQQKCVGCTACQAACPNDVITMVKTPFTAADFPNPMPDTNKDGQTNIEGLYLVGEASGDALIKMAVNSGLRAIEDISKTLPKIAPDPECMDILIVGSGPAGLSAALAAKERQLSFLIFDKTTIASTIRNFPRKKVVMAEPAHIPLYGALWMKDTTKEELIEKWGEIIKSTGLEIRVNEEITKVEKKTDHFEVTTAKGKYRARRVVLATGNRGAPRKLGVKGEASPRVQYTLTEPEECKGKHVLIVGGGDSAVEAAMSVADVEGTHVTISYRKDSFGRIKARNKTRLEEYEKAGRVEVILKSSVSKLDDGKATLSIEGGPERELANDQIFALLGAEPPTKLFASMGITIHEPKSEGMEKFAKSRGDRHYASKCDHCTGHEDQACIAACPTEAIFEVKPEEVFAAVGDAQTRGVFSPRPFVEGLESRSKKTAAERIAPAAALASMLIALVIGVECFLRALLPEASALYAWQKLTSAPIAITYASGFGLGYNLGITGTALMILTALYPLHTKVRLLMKIARTRLWMAAHIFAGITGPMLVTYHTRLKLDRWPAAAFWSMWLVVLTGIIGRFIFTWFRRSASFAELEKRTSGHEENKLFAKWSGTEGRTRVFQFSHVSEEVAQGSNALVASFAFFGRAIAARLRFAWMRWSTLRGIEPALRKETLRVFAEHARADRKAAFLKSAERSAGIWKKLHVSLTVALFAIAAAHIVFAMLFKAT